MAAPLVFFDIAAPDVAAELFRDPVELPLEGGERLALDRNNFV